MENDSKDNNSKDNNTEFTFVQEKVKSKRNKKVKKILTGLACTVAFAVIFGFVARIVFIRSEGAVNKLLGITPAPTAEAKRSEVKLLDVSVEPTISPTAVPTASPSATPTPTPAAEAPDKEPGGEKQTALEEYTRMMKELKGVTYDVNRSLLTISAVSEEINWLNETIVNEEKLSGVIMGDNGVELLLLASYDKVKDANSITVQVSANLTTEATLYNYDSDVNLAVLAVKLEDIPEHIMNELKAIELGSSTVATTGTPIIALGSPNGLNGSVEFGFVTAVGGASYVTDGKVDLFYTDVTSCEDSDGIIVNLDGQLLGFITTKLSSKNPINSCTSVGISSLEKVVLNLLNNTDRAYLGVKAEDIPTDDLKRLELANGIYVSDVLDGSPAEKAGLKKGDVICSIRIAGQEEPAVIRSVSGYMAALAQVNVGDTISIDVYRSSAAENRELTLDAVVAVK